MTWPALGWEQVGIILAIGAVLGLLPGVMARLAAAMYPKGSAERQEMLAGLVKAPRRDRLIEAFWLLEMGLFEGLPARRGERRERRTARARAREVRRNRTALILGYLSFALVGTQHYFPGDASHPLRVAATGLAAASAGLTTLGIFRRLRRRLR